MNRCVLMLTALLIVSTRSWNAAQAQDVPPKRPAYQVLRYHEDWSAMRDLDASADRDFFDPIKYVPLSEDGQIWASFGGQVRLRFEAWNNFNFGGPAPLPKGNDSDDEFLLTRVMLHADVHLGRHLRFFVEGKSALATDRDLFGDNRTLDRDELDLQNGFADLILPLGDDGDSLTFRAGRQEMLFGKQRLVSPLDWANSRRTFDGFTGILKLEGWTLTGFWSRFVPVKKYDFNEQDANTEFYGVYATGKCPVTGIGVDLYWLGLASDSMTFPGSPFGAYNTTVGDEDRHTVGGRLFGKCGDSGLDYDLEGAYQFGEVGSADIDAFMVAAQVGYSPTDCPMSPRVFLGIDYASGDETPGGDVQTFSQLFPLGHAYFGWIDQIGRQNIIDLSSGLTVRPIQKLTVDLQGHVYWRADDSDALYNAGGVPFRPAGGGGLSRHVGSEIDLLVRYALDRHTELSLGYSHFFAGPFLEQTGKSDDIDFFYLGLQYTF